MHPTRRIGTSALALAALLYCGAALAGPRKLESASTNVVATWHDIAVATFTGAGTGMATLEEKQPVVYADMATVALAMYDAASAVDGRYRPYGVAPRVPAQGASIDAAVSAAAYGVLRGLFPSRSAHYQAAFDQFVSRQPAGPARNKGLALGAEVAAATLANRAADGRNVELTPYVRGTAIGKYQGEKAVLMYAPSLRPFTMVRMDQFRPGPPPAMNSAAYAADVNETKALGGTASKLRTEAQSQVALFNTEGPVTSLTRNFGRFARSSSDPADAARLLAAAYVVNADAIIACFDAKYYYNAWRPHSAIAQADQDDNPATEPDPAWTSSQFTPYHPEYPAAHSCTAAALAGVLRHLYGTSEVSFTLDSSVTGTARTFPDTETYLREAAESRIAGGMHFRFSTVAGQKLGSEVADHAMRRYFGMRQ
jgi:hypothetical protein